jgi:hypothetical protein
MAAVPAHQAGILHPLVWKAASKPVRGRLIHRRRQTGLPPMSAPGSIG